MKPELDALVGPDLPSDPLDAIEKIARGLSDFLANNPAIGGSNYVDVCQVFGFLCAYVNRVGQEIGIGTPSIPLGTDRENNLRNIRALVGGVVNEILGRRVHNATQDALKDGEKMFEERFEPPLVYEFSDSDCTRIHQLIEELGRLIEATDELNDSHKKRLKKRLQSLRVEIARKVSNVDKMWGVAAEAWMTAKVVIANPEKVDQWMNVIGKLLAIIAAAQLLAQGLPANQLPQLLPWLGNTNK